MYSNTPGKAMKKRLVFGRLMSLSAKYFQGSAIAATGEGCPTRSSNSSVVRRGENIGGKFIDRG